MYNPETGEEETWSWLRFNMYVRDFGEAIAARQYAESNFEDQEHHD